MGMISIPKINQTIPIYHGTDDSVLQVGAGHLPGTALPVGGENTHCVLAAHRGLPPRGCSATSTSWKKGT